MKKGFTLIELLAVIVILAIIATIATPIVLSIIEETKESAVLRSAEHYLGAVEQSIAKKSMEIGSSYRPNTCEIQENGNLLCDPNTEKETELSIEIAGSAPEEGTIAFEHIKIKKVENLKFEKFYINIDEAGNKKISNEPNILITSVEVSYSHCYLEITDNGGDKELIDTCVPEIKIEPENATNKTLEFSLDEYYYNECDGESLFNGRIVLNSTTGEISTKNKINYSDSGKTLTYITIKTTDGSNILQTKEVALYITLALCPIPFSS